MYSVYGVDTFSDDSWREGLFRTLEAAKAKADDIAKGKQMTKAYVYDADGQCVYSQGSY